MDGDDVSYQKREMIIIAISLISRKDDYSFVLLNLSLCWCVCRRCYQSRRIIEYAKRTNRDVCHDTYESHEHLNIFYCTLCTVLFHYFKLHFLNIHVYVF